mgnify:CR=1 FL=1
MKKLSKPIIKEKIEKLNNYFSSYPNKDRENRLKELDTKIDNQEYKIAVVANMSAGKSTFINALFGKNVLPSFEHATTDCATYIYSKPNIDKKAKIYFNDNKKTIEVIENLEDEITQYAQKDEDCKDDKYKNVEKIELYYPFKNLQTSSSEDFSITFVDTPGPNSTGDFGQKHKDQTRSVLNSVDMALFTFDYEQLDANLKSDEQGLWNTVKTRHEKDKNFEVYFLINKIDSAMDDNFKEVKSAEDEKKQWYVHEKEAIDKLIKAAQSHGIENPNIYPVTSKFALLDRENTFHGRKDLLPFKEIFREAFDKWEEEYIKYLGLEKLEKDINQYINTSVKEKILKIAIDNINEVENDELSSLTERKLIFSKPKEEAEKNINASLSFLDNEAKELEDNMLTKFEKSEEKYKQEIVKLISSAIKDELYAKVDEMSKIAIAYAIATADGANTKIASSRAKQNINFVELQEEVQIELDKSINIDEVMSKMQDYMKTLFDEYKNNYLDVKTDLKNSYVSYEREIAKTFRQTKENLNTQLQNTLDIDVKSVEIKTIDIDSTLSFDVTIPDSVLDYKYQEEEYHYRSNVIWWNPISWFSDDTRVVDQEEKHLLVINPLDLKSSIEKNMNETVEKFSNIEQRNYTDAIVALRRENSDIFQDFRLNKQKEIDKLQEDVKNSEKELEVVEKQIEKFKQIIKD